MVIIITFKKTRKTALSDLGLLIFGLTITQIAIGVLTLLSRVQLHTATTHQFIAIILLLSVVRLNYLSNEKSQ